MLGALAALRERPGAGRRRERTLPGLKLGSLVGFLVLVSLSRSPLFLEAAAALELAILARLDARAIARTLRKALGAGLFACAILLPAALIGRGAGIATLSAKILLAVLAAALYSATSSWPSIAAAFASLRVPDLFVMTLDMAVKYISLLGGLVLDMLAALKLRSVGRDDRKADSLGAIAGTVFLKSREAAEEQYGAMQCRCYTGKYRVDLRVRFGSRDLAALAVGAGLLALFLACGGAR